MPDLGLVSLITWVFRMGLGFGRGSRFCLGDVPNTSCPLPLHSYPKPWEKWIILSSESMNIASVANGRSDCSSPLWVGGGAIESVDVPGGSTFVDPLNAAEIVVVSGGFPGLPRTIQSHCFSFLDLTGFPASPLDLRPPYQR